MSVTPALWSRIQAQRDAGVAPRVIAQALGLTEDSVLGALRRGGPRETVAMRVAAHRPALVAAMRAGLTNAEIGRRFGATLGRMGDAMAAELAALAAQEGIERTRSPGRAVIRGARAAILPLMRDGLSNAEIARRLNLPEGPPLDRELWALARAEGVPRKALIGLARSHGAQPPDLRAAPDDEEERRAAERSAMRCYARVDGRFADHPLAEAGADTLRRLAARASRALRDLIARELADRQPWRLTPPPPRSGSSCALADLAGARA